MPAPPPRDPSAMWHKRSTGLPSTPSGQTCRPSGILACGFSRGRGQTGLSTATLDLVTFEFALSLSRGQRLRGAEHFVENITSPSFLLLCLFLPSVSPVPVFHVFSKIHKDNFNCNQCDFKALIRQTHESESGQMVSEKVK